MTDLTDFLLARIAEDEAMASAVQRAGMSAFVTPARVLAECEAKRRIVARVQMSQMQPPQISEHAANAIMLALALPYADHPDYREEWRP